MDEFFSLIHHDLVTPDGAITKILSSTPDKIQAIVTINNISPCFLGFTIDKSKIFFNLKSTIAQLGINGQGVEYELSSSLRMATVTVNLNAINEIGKLFLQLLECGAYIGKLFALDERRRVRDPQYLSRMFKRTDREGKPLLSFGGAFDKEELELKKLGDRTIAFLPLTPGTYTFDPSIKGLLPTLVKALKNPDIKTRDLLRLSQIWKKEEEKKVKPNELLIVHTTPLHIRTVFARVVNELLPKGVFHTTASILQPDTTASGDVYELFGESDEVITHIPLEFYTLNPYREYVFFSDRDQLQACLEKTDILFNAIKTAPEPIHHKCAVFIVKGKQLLDLKPGDWIQKEVSFQEFPGFFHPAEQVEKVERYMHEQPSYPILEAIQKGIITSQGILLTRYLLSPLMKRMLLSEEIYRCLKGIYFRYPSRSHGDFFSHEDRSLFLDLARFGIPLFWLDEKTQNILQYIPKPEKDAGMFVPLPYIETFIKATMIGIYGSHLVAGEFTSLITELLEGLLYLKNEMFHPLLNSTTPLALSTGGGPGIMNIGNQIAKKLGILSCANIVDFSSHPIQITREQEQNPYIEAKMTYQLDRLVERQAEFHLDLPIFFVGGIGTDFEYALEEIRRTTGIKTPTPILLVGEPEYWKNKISSCFYTNLKSKTVFGTEWVSNCFYCIQNAKQGLAVYRDFFSGKLPIGPKGPIYKEGFKII